MHTYRQANGDTRDTSGPLEEQLPGAWVDGVRA
jgi:hypothetical protein